MVSIAASNSGGRFCLLYRSLEEARGEAQKKRRTSGPRPTFHSEELERFLLIHVLKQLLGEALHARRFSNETFTASEWQTLSRTWAGATQRAIPDEPKAAAHTWAALKRRFGEYPVDVLELILRDRPLEPPLENAKCGEFTQVGDLLLTAREVALAQPAAPAAHTSTNHAERVRLTFGTDRKLEMQFSGEKNNETSKNVC
jgi:hypothetical protein